MGLTQTTRLVSGIVDVVHVAHGIPVIPVDHELVRRIHSCCHHSLASFNACLTNLIDITNQDRFDVGHSVDR